jgi:diguanylate cyclase (GGDEF)-like protein
VLGHFRAVTAVLLVAGLVAAVLVAAALYRIRMRQTLDERVEAAAGRLAVEWASRPELAALLDPEEVLEQTLSEVAALPGVDAALAVLGGEGERRTVALGISEEDARRIALQAPESANLRALEVVYRYRLDDAAEASARPRAGMVVPLRAGDQALGSLAALSRSSSARFFDGAVDAFESIARRAGPALVTARRFAEARQLAELDSLTGLFNRRAFQESLAREIARARRYERRLALVLLDLDDFKRINDTAGHLTGDAVLAEVGRRILAIVRATDIACRFGGDEFAVILPESTRADGDLLADRIVRTLAAATVDKAGPIHASAGVAELAADGTAADLFERADVALYRAKNAGKARTAAG